MATWEQKRNVTHIITQNIDGLHQKAGSDQVIEFHGSMKNASCMNYRRKDVLMMLINKGDSPYDYVLDTYVIHNSIGKTLAQIKDHLN